MPRRSNARQQMIGTAIELFRKDGVEATSFADVLEASGAPRGSVYHHFPEGKAQLVEEATRTAGDFISVAHEYALREGPLSALRGLAAYWRGVLKQSAFQAGCPIVAVTVEGDLTPGARDAAAEVFEHWERQFMEGLKREGVPARRARALATMVVAATEGAVLLARARRSLAPYNRVAGELEEMVGAAVAEAAPAGGVEA
jgi:AcrR family transcriptional regulator